MEYLLCGFCVGYGICININAYIHISLTSKKKKTNRTVNFLPFLWYIGKKINITLYLLFVCFLQKKQTSAAFSPVRVSPLLFSGKFNVSLITWVVFKNFRLNKKKQQQKDKSFSPLIGRKMLKNAGRIFLNAPYDKSVYYPAFTT